MLIGIPPASPLSPVSYPAASTRRLGGAIFQALGVLSADNKQADTRRPKLQRLAEIEASRLCCVSLRRLAETGTRLQKEPAVGACAPM